MRAALRVAFTGFTLKIHSKFTFCSELAVTKKSTLVGKKIAVFY